MAELLGYSFFQNALVACLLTGIVCGLMGCYIVCRRMVFLSGGIAHTALGGVGICALLGWPVILGAAASALLMGWGTMSLARRREIRQDSAIAMLWALGMSIGIMCSYLAPSFLPDLSNYLFGNILLITPTDLWMLGALSVVVLLVFLLAANQIVSVAFDVEFAKAQRQRVRLVELLMLSLAALSIVFTLKVAGVVLVISLLSVPQMTANLFCRSFWSMAIVSVAISFLGCLGGLLASVWFNVPTGVMVVIVVVLIYIIARTIKRMF